jgi:hypothetical protein
MSNTKFASITASLLARKGEAQPWNHNGMPETEKISLPWRTYTEAAPTPPPPPPGKERSCTIRMSAHDFERLGILAVKKDVTRQQLLRDALAEFLDHKAQDYGCACLGACNRNCGSDA